MNREIGNSFISSLRKVNPLSLGSPFARSIRVPLAATISLFLVAMPLPALSQLSGNSCQGPSNGTPQVISLSTSSATVGSTIAITGVNFLGTTSVLINGTQAAFTISSDSSILVTVPNAASGQLTIVSPGGSYTTAGLFNILRRPDLVALNRIATGSGKTEIHGLYSDSNYQTSILDVATTYGVNPANILQMIDMDGDATPDLVFLNQTSTGSGKAEIHVLSAASNFQSSILDVAANLDLDTRNKLQMIDMDSDGRPDLVVINNGVLGTDPTTIFILSAASNYQTLILGTITTFASNPANIYQMIDIDGDTRPDLVSLNQTSTGSGKAEIHVLSAASNFQSSILDVAANLDLDTRNKLQMIDMDSDGRPDLVVINQGVSGTDPTTIFILSAASNYQTLILGTVSAFPYNPGNIYQSVNLNRNPSAISQYQAPRINSFTPTSGVAGANVTITGSGLSAVNAVKFFGTPAAIFTINSSTQITASVPNTSGLSGPIGASTASGVASSNSNFILPSPAVSSDPNAILSSTTATAPQFAVAPGAVQYFSTGATFPQFVYRSLSDYYGIAIPKIASQPGSTGLQPINPSGSPRLTAAQYNYFGSNSDNGRNVFLGTDGLSTSATFTTSTTGSVVIENSANTAVTPFGKNPLTFVASDTPLNSTEVFTYTVNQFPTRGNPIQVPTGFGAVATAYNQTGSPGSTLNISTANLCRIFDGTITNYNQLTAPSTTTTSSLPIKVVIPSDSSSTTNAFTSYLANACPSALGTSYYLSKGVNVFPTTGSSAGFMRVSGGDPSLANSIGATTGGLGYTASSFASPYQSNTPDGLRPAPLAASLQNPVSGSFIFPTPTAINSSLAGISLTANTTYSCVLSVAGLPVVPTVGSAYPIVMPTYIITYTRFPTTAEGTAVRGLFNFVIGNRTVPNPQANDQIAQGLGFSILNNGTFNPATGTNTLRSSARACINTITSP